MPNLLDIIADIQYHVTFLPFIPLTDRYGQSNIRNLTDLEKQKKFLELFMPLQKRLDRFALSRSWDINDAKDMVGETILIAFDRFETLKNPEAFLSFLFTIANRVGNQRNTQSKRFERLESHHIENLLDSETSPDILTDIKTLNVAINSLPFRERDELILFEILGFSIKEIIEIHGGTIVALKVRLMRSRNKLRKMLQSKSEQMKQQYKSQQDVQTINL